MGTMEELLGGDSRMLLKVLAYTVFYAALAYLPLRGAAAVVARMRERNERRRIEEHRARLGSRHSTIALH